MSLYLYSLCCVRVCQPERTEAFVAAIAGTYANSDMAGFASRSPACRRAENTETSGKDFLIAGRPVVA